MAIWPAKARLLRGVLCLSVAAWFIHTTSNFPGHRYDNVVFEATFGFAALFLAGLLMIRAVGAWVFVGPDRFRAAQWFGRRVDLASASIGAYSMDRDWLYVRLPGGLRQIELNCFTTRQRRQIRDQLARHGVASEPQRSFGQVGWIVGLFRLLFAFGGAFFGMMAWLSWVTPELVIGGGRAAAFGSGAFLLFLLGAWFHAELDYLNWRVDVTHDRIELRNWRRKTSVIDVRKVSSASYVSPPRGGDYIQVQFEDQTEAIIQAGKTSNTGALRQAIEDITGKQVVVVGALARIARREHRRKVHDDD